MATDKPKTILLKGDGVFKEAKSGGTISPGMFLARAAAGTVAAHAVAGGDITALVALENEDFGFGIEKNYSANERVRMVVPWPGSEIYALVPANATAIVIGDLLMSNGNGMLKKFVAQGVAESGSATFDIASRIVVARAVEAVDNSSNSTGPARIKVEIV